MSGSNYDLYVSCLESMKSSHWTSGYTKLLLFLDFPDSPTGFLRNCVCKDAMGRSGGTGRAWEMVTPSDLWNEVKKMLGKSEAKVFSPKWWRKMVMKMNPVCADPSFTISKMQKCRTNSSQGRMDQWMDGNGWGWTWKKILKTLNFMTFCLFIYSFAI